MPAVSILVPTYNQARYLDEALASARAQTFGDLDILVLDNASDDDTPDVARRHAAADPRVRYVRNERNLGLVGNFNRALELASAPLVKFLCSDDVLEPACVERLRSMLMQDPEIILAACARRFIDAEGRTVGGARYAKHATTVTGREVVAHTFFAGNVIGEPTAVLFRAVDARPAFDPRFHQLVDFELWCRLLERGALAFDPEPLCRVRRHAEQASARNLRSGRVLAERRMWFDRFGARVAPRASTREKAEWDLRMAAAVARSAEPVDVAGIREVFLPWFFRWIALPAARAGARWMGGAG